MKSELSAEVAELAELTTPEAEGAAANAEVNGVELALTKVDVRADPLPMAPTVVSNLTGNLVRDCAEQMVERGERPERLVCSGMLVEETDEVTTAPSERGEKLKGLGYIS